MISVVRPPLEMCPVDSYAGKLTYFCEAFLQEDVQENTIHQTRNDYLQGFA